MNNDESNQSAQSKFDRLLTAARHGDVEAMLDLGTAYRVGDLVAQDYAQSLVWLRRAAEQGAAEAQNDLGSMFLNGMGTERDAVEATLWYRLAAQQGQPDAQFNLALRYLHGQGVALDLDSAFHWLCQAIEHGHIEATGQLGTLFRFGQGVERNIVSAADLHVIAASRGDVSSMGNLVDYQDEIEKAALTGSVLAALCLAKLHDRGITVPQNKTLAWAWLEWAAQHGNKDNDPDILEELRDWMSFENMFISESIKQDVAAMLVQMEQQANSLQESHQPDTDHAGHA
jgi:TPR repeat protein